MNEQELRIKFDNESNCYADCNEVVLAMDGGAAIAFAKAYADARESKEIAELKQWQDEAIRLTSEVQKMYAIELEQQSEIKRLRDALLWLKETRTPDREMIEVFIEKTLSPAPVTDDKFSISAYPPECSPTLKQLTENDNLTMMERLEKRMPPFHKIAPVTDSPKNEDQE